MKIVYPVLAIAVLASTPGYSQAQNPNQIALLRWYSANQTATFPFPGSPYGLVFDGSSIWISNISSASVTKVRASDGTVLGTFPVGSNPQGLAFDGAKHLGSQQRRRHGDGAPE